MKNTVQAIDFHESNTVIAKDHSEYLDLCAHVSNNGCVTTFWKPTLRQKIKILFGGIWLQTLSFNQPLQPLKMLVSNPFPSTRGLRIGVDANG